MEHNKINFYIGNIVPEPDTIFVFGSNPEGRHGAGSAAVARKQFGAIYGQGEGLQGNAYALPTTELRYDKQVVSKDDRVVSYSRQSLPFDTIVSSIKKLYDTARKNPNLKFKVAYRNQPDEVTLCGYAGKDLMNMFVAATDGTHNYPDNIYFSKEWIDAGIL